MKRTVRYLVLVAALTLSAYPLLWMMLAALRQEGDLLRNPFALQGGVTGANLGRVLGSGAFLRAYANSLFVCSLSVALTVGMGAMAAYALARLRFRGRHLILLLFLAGLTVPVHVTLIPLNRLLGASGLGLKGTPWALIGPYVGFGLPVTILILRTAFSGVPDTLFQAARMDGCGVWGSFWHVGVPLVRPALATVVIFNFLTMWNEFAFALTLISDERLRTLPLALWQFKGERGMYVTETCAALCVGVVPVLVVYALAQRQIIAGLTAGAVKE